MHAQNRSDCACTDRTSVQRVLGPGHREGLPNTTAVFSAFLHKEMDSDDARTLTVSLQTRIQAF